MKEHFHSSRRISGCIFTIETHKCAKHLETRHPTLFVLSQPRVYDASQPQEVFGSCSTYQLGSSAPSSTYSSQHPRTPEHNHQDRSVQPISHNFRQKRIKSKQTSFFSQALSFNSSTLSFEYLFPCPTLAHPLASLKGYPKLTHSVANHPGNTALTLTFGPCVLAKHLIKCNCAALVTLYGILLPASVRPAMLEVMMKTPPWGLELNVGAASRIRKAWAFTFTA